MFIAHEYTRVKLIFGTECNSMSLRKNNANIWFIVGNVNALMLCVVQAVKRHYKAATNPSSSA